MVLSGIKPGNRQFKHYILLLLGLLPNKQCLREKKLHQRISPAASVKLCTEYQSTPVVTPKLVITVSISYFKSQESVTVATRTTNIYFFHTEYLAFLLFLLFLLLLWNEFKMNIQTLISNEENNN